jgi:putative Mg2+ transporter-C (MgtC) family protein
MSDLVERAVALLMSYRWDIAGHMVLAALLAGLIGLEREWRGHAAGLRTNILVGVGSCLFTTLSIEGFPLRGANQDTARVAAQIVTGVGFLGAGAVLHDRSRVRGLTTAATIWLVAAIGMAVGTGLYFLAVFTTVLTTTVLVVLRPVSARLPGEARRRRKARKRDPQNGWETRARPDDAPAPGDPGDPPPRDD